MRGALHHFSFLSILCLPILALGIAMPRAMAFAPGLIGVILFGFMLKDKSYKSIRIDYKLCIFLVCIPCLAALSSLWAIDPDIAISRAIKLCIIFTPALLLFFAAQAVSWTHKAFNLFYKGLYGLFCLCGLAVAFEYETELMITSFVRDTAFGSQSPRFVLNRSLVVLSLLYLPVMAAVVSLYEDNIKKKILHCGFATACLVAPLLVTKSQTAQLCFVVGLIFFWVYPYAQDKLWKILTGFICFLLFAAPWAVMPLYKFIPEERADIPPLVLEASIPHRLEVWNFVAVETAKSPWIGHGIEAVRNMTSERWMVYPNNNQILHPHNAALQIWVEFGLVGALFTCAFIIFLMNRVGRMQGLYRRLSMAMFMSALAVLATGYGVWQSWQIGLLIFLPTLSYLTANRTLSMESKS